MTNLNIPIDKPLLDIYYFAPCGCAKEIENKEDLITELSNSYQLKFRVRGAPCGGGFYELVVNLFTLQSILSILVGGVIYDLLKSSIYKISIEPLLATIKNHRAKHNGLDISKITINFSDTIIEINKFGVIDFTEEIPKILRTISENIEYMNLRGEYPERITVPICKDIDRSNNNKLIFRVYKEFDDYFVFDGLVDYHECFGVYYAKKDAEYIYSVTESKIYETHWLDGNDAYEFISKNFDQYEKMKKRIESI